MSRPARRTVALALLFATLAAGACSRPLPHRLVAAPGWWAPDDTLRPTLFLAEDLDGDGREELVAAAPGGFEVLVWRDGQVTQAWRAKLPRGFGMRRGSVQIGACADVTGDGRPEIVLAAMREDAALWGVWTCDAASREPQLLANLGAGPDRRADGVWDGNWFVAGVLPAGAVGPGAAVLAVCRTGYDWPARCVLALEAVTGRELWRFACGPNPERLVIADVDGDLTPEIVLTGNSQDNLGSERLNDTSDNVAMLFVLNACGRLRWSRQLGSVYVNTLLRIADVNGDGAPEIVTATDTHSTDQDDRLCVWSGDGTLLAERVLRAPTEGLVVPPATAGSAAAIYVGDQAGWLTRFAIAAGALTEAARLRVDASLRPLLAAELTAEPGLEIVAWTTNGRAHLLTADLRPLGRLDGCLPASLPASRRPTPDARPAVWQAAPGVEILLVPEMGGALRVTATLRGADAKIRTARRP